MKENESVTQKIYDISLIIPVYNAANYLEKTLDCVVHQTIFDKIEVILVNDGSNDSSLEICRKYEKPFNNIKVIDQKNAGVSSARNVGLSYASGTYIAFLDSDDLIDKDLYERELNLIRTYEADIAIVDFDKVHLDGAAKKYRPDGQRKWTNRNAALRDFFSGVIGNQVCDKLFSKRSIESVKFPIGYKIGEDMYFVYQALQNSGVVVLDSSICGYHYIVRKESAMTGSFSDKYFDPVKLSEKMYLDYSDDVEMSPYAKAHLIHETCKSLEYTYRHHAEAEFAEHVSRMKKNLKSYNLTQAKKYLIKRQFYGFLLMRISPYLYMLVHKIMRVG